MTLRNLNEGFLALTVSMEGKAPLAKTALAFVFDRGYLRPFKVLLYSLAKTYSFLDIPILIFTQDELVARDPVVVAVADEIRFVNDLDIEQFSDISADRIKAAYRLDWIPKYTFLKWLIFDDYPDINRLIFIDADIICLGNADSIADSCTNYDLASGLVFRPSLFKDNEVIKGEQTIYQNLKGMIDGSFPVDIKRLNTGVLVVQRNCLSRHFRDELLDLTGSCNYVNEQSYVTKAVTDEGSYTVKYLSAKYNFGAGSLSYLSLHHQLQILKDIIFLHYPGSKKPWKSNLTIDTRFSHLLWMKMEKEAMCNTNLFAGQVSKPESHDLTTADV